MKHNTARRKVLIEQFKSELQIMIRTLRKEKGLTQKQLATLLGVDQATISNFESGKTVMNLIQAYEIYLIFGKEYTNPALTMPLSTRNNQLLVNHPLSDPIY